MNKLYRFNWDCGRMGHVEGVFIADSAEVSSCIGREVYFGEILGKHSEVQGTLEEGELTVLSDDKEFIDKLSDVFCGTRISGYCPLDYLSEEGECEDEE